MAGAATMTNLIGRGLAGSTHPMDGSNRCSASKSLKIATLSALLSVPLFVASTAAWSQTGLRFEAMQAALSGAPLSSTAPLGDDPVSALADFLKASPGAGSPHGGNAQDAKEAPLDHTQQLEAEAPQLISADQPAHALGGNADFAALAAFAEQRQAREPNLKLAEAKAKPAKAAKVPVKGAADD